MQKEKEKMMEQFVKSLAKLDVQSKIKLRKEFKAYLEHRLKSV